MSVDSAAVHAVNAVAVAVNAVATAVTGLTLHV